jgi:exodeoxyribonuclease-3
METRCGLPGDPDDTHSRYIEAAIGDTFVGCLCMPNGNPAPGALNSRYFRPVRRKETRARR